MRKIGHLSFGIIIGAALAWTSSAYGAEIASLIGKKVDGQTTLYLDGNVLDKAIIVEGKSYAPIRAIGEAVGKEVSFEEGEVFLSSIESSGGEEVDVTEEVVFPELVSLQKQKDQLTTELERTQRSITFLETSRLPELEKRMNEPDTELGKRLSQTRYENEKSYYEQQKVQLTDLQSQLAEVEEQIYELEAEKAALESDNG